MRITRTQLKRIIQEEVRGLLSEQELDWDARFLQGTLASENPDIARAARQTQAATATDTSSPRRGREYTSTQMDRRRDQDVIAAAAEMSAETGQRVSPRAYARRMARGVEGYDDPRQQTPTTPTAATSEPAGRPATPHLPGVRGAPEPEPTRQAPPRGWEDMDVAFRAAAASEDPDHPLLRRAPLNLSSEWLAAREEGITASEFEASNYANALENRRGRGLSQDEREEIFANFAAGRVPAGWDPNELYTQGFGRGMSLEEMIDRMVDEIL